MTLPPPNRSLSITQQSACRSFLLDRARSGRPRVTTARQDRLMRLTHLRNRTRTAVETAITTSGTHIHRISAQTVRNRLREFGDGPSLMNN
jgi:hypothetical protein